MDLIGIFFLSYYNICDIYDNEHLLPTHGFSTSSKGSPIQESPNLR